MIELSLPTMTCNHCVSTVTAAVRSVDAGAKVEVNLPEHRVKIESKRPVKDFISVLTEQGYAPA